jgi:hypothetical protein
LVQRRTGDWFGCQASADGGYFSGVDKGGFNNEISAEAIDLLPVFALPGAKPAVVGTAWSPF